MNTLVQLAEAEGAYQDIIIDGRVVVKGYRDCSQRWKIIRPYLKNQQTVLDIGSHYGYFGMRIAKALPQAFVWSIEEESKRAEIQRMALIGNRVTNIVLSEASVSLLKLLKLQRTCEMLDTILAFSVIHYFPLEEIPEVIWALSRLAPNLIIEFPVATEDDVANKHLVDSLDPEYLLGLIYASVRMIGETPSPKDPNVLRPVYLAQNYKITRENCMSYWSSASGGHHTVTYEDATWNLDGRPRTYNGLNLANLRHFDVTYPDPAQWIREAASRYYDLIQQNNGHVTDIHPRNLIVGHSGVFPIDYSEYCGETIYDMSWSKYQEGVLGLSEQDIEQGLWRRYEEDLRPAILKEEP